MARPFLTAHWRHLVMLSYEIDPAVLLALVPAGTVLDAYQGRYFVSIVAFLFLDTRVLGVPIPFHRNFEEINLRFYVRRDTPAENRRGVVFVKEIVPRRAIAFAARVLYEEPYTALPTRHALRYGGRDGKLVESAVYEWKFQHVWQRIAAEVAEAPRAPSDGTLEEFITEHYWGYTKRRDGSTSEYRVEHPRWNLSACSSASLCCDIAGLYGRTFAPFLEGPPASALIAEGSAVAVYPGTTLPQGITIVHA